MSRVILFAGTTEGRKISDKLRELNIDTNVRVATESGADMITSGGSIKVVAGRMDMEKIRSLILQEKANTVIDATHPYAVDVSHNIQEAVCDICVRKDCGINQYVRNRCGINQYAIDHDVQLIRVLREHDDTWDGDNIYYFDDMDQLIEWLNTTDERIFSTLGAKEAMQLTMVKNYKDRVVLRILPSVESVRICQNAGYSSDSIICMQPPFSEEINKGLFNDKKCGIMITKDTGRAGGMPEKMAAAISCGMKIGIVRRPKEAAGVAKIMELEEVLEYIEMMGY